MEEQQSAFPFVTHRDLLANTAKGGALHCWGAVASGACF
jgi:hypothetical protein